MILLVTGGRKRTDSAFVHRILDEINGTTPIEVLIEGGAWGVDRLARDWAVRAGVHVATVEALWNSYGKAAGAIRNEAMLSLKPDRVVAFPSANSPGTSNCISKTLKRGIPITIHTHDGKVHQR